VSLSTFTSAPEVVAAEDPVTQHAATALACGCAGSAAGLRAAFGTEPVRWTGGWVG